MPLEPVQGGAATSPSEGVPAAEAPAGREIGRTVAGGLLLRRGLSVAFAAATDLVVLGVTVVLLLTPAYIHAALAQSGSATILGVSEAQAQSLSDQTVHEIVFGPQTFAFPFRPGGPAFYDTAEANHLRDVHDVLYAFLLVVAIAVVVLAFGLARWHRERWLWRSIGRGAAFLVVAFVAVGIFFSLEFDTAFTLFHEIFFPEGDWSFNTATQRLVQLYPTPFWELTATVLALLAIGLSLAVWVTATRRARR